MEITSTTSATTNTIALNGWLDTNSAPSFSEAIEQVIHDDKALVLDFAGLEYISSAGLRVLVATQKKLHGSLTIKDVSPEVMQVLRMTDFDKLFNIV